MRHRKIIIAIGLTALVGVFACARYNGPDNRLVLSAEEGEQLAGGSNNTVFDQSTNAFGFSAPALKGMDELNFAVGNSFFKQNWVSAPASAESRDGLGPYFNARTCSGCHFKDGRGRPPRFDGEEASGLLLRLSIPGVNPYGGPRPDPNYGDQLQDRGIQGITREGNYSIVYTEIEKVFPDGETYALRQPEYVLNELNYGPLSGDVQISPRVGQQIIGMGLLEAILESDILALADENDADKDGISGRPNRVWDVFDQSERLGRFGWKANQPTVVQQTASAFHGDMGITSSPFPEQNCADPQGDCQNAPDGGAPEVTDESLESIVLYVSNLAVPARRDFDQPEVLQGKNIFNAIGCAKCHTPSFKTGIHDRFDNLSNQTIWPYTDLLLHDMGPGLADNRPDFKATGQEWRTQPLWGLGLIKSVNGHEFLLHDGRARNVQEAILWHGGEAEAVTRNFKNLSKAERAALLTFLYSL
ncbi:MAG: di-heme oxidoredictase family protein [Salibacteraceae bacterium]